MEIYIAINKEQTGPFSKDEVLRKLANGEIISSVLAWHEGISDWIPLDQILADTKREGESFQYAAANFSKKVASEIYDLRVPLMLPLAELRSTAWIKNKTAIEMMVVGLFPLFTLVFLSNDPRSAYWSLAFYFSAIWGLYFYGELAPPNAKKSKAFLCFFGTSLISIAVLLGAYHIPPLNFLHALSESAHLPIRFIGMLTGVAIPEEICKALVLFYLLSTTKERIPLNTMIFYGLISGLGFGIYEGVAYQMNQNVESSESFSDYYILNMLRLTSAPFGHAIYTGITGYFLGISAFYPSHKRGLIFMAIFIPSLFHAFGNTFNGIYMLAGDALAVITLFCYYSKSQEFSNVLDKKILPQ